MKLFLKLHLDGTVAIECGQNPPGSYNIILNGTKVQLWDVT
jgi:hypothetical protein